MSSEKGKKKSECEKPLSSLSFSRALRAALRISSLSLAFLRGKKAETWRKRGAREEERKEKKMKNEERKKNSKTQKNSLEESVGVRERGGAPPFASSDESLLLTVAAAMAKADSCSVIKWRSRRGKGEGEEEEEVVS